MAANCRMRIEALDAYLHGMLNETQHREITAHLLVCPECNQNLASLEAETYTIGKALRNIEAPPLTTSAKDLVARYSAAKPKQAPAPYSALESSHTMQPVAALPKSDLPKKSSRFLRRVGSGAVSAWNLAQSRSLFKVAAVTFVSGMALWFAAATANRIQSIGQAQTEQTSRFTSIERTQAEIHRLLERNTQENQRLIADLQEQLQKSNAQQTTLAQLQLMEAQDKLSTAIAGLKTQIDQVGRSITANNDDSARLKKDLDKRMADLLAQQAEVNVLAERLKKLTEAPADAPAVANAAEADEPGTLKLLADGESTVDWREKEGSPLGALIEKGQPIGWAVTLSNLPGTTLADDTSVELPRYTGTAAFNGKVFVGNGAAEHNLVAFDGASGEKLWSVHTKDTGGSAPVVSEDGRTVIFTENSWVRAINVSNGVQNWVRNVGGAALTQPAIDAHAHHLYLVHATSRNSPLGVGDTKFPFSITCLHADGGNVVWTKGLPADAITSPVVENGKVFVATRDGVINIYDIHGNCLKSYQANATSAPTIAGGEIYFSAWAPNRHAGFEESLCNLAVDNSGRGVERLSGAYPASYFVTLPMNSSMSNLAGGNLDPVRALANTEQSVPALGNTWSYYGARPTVADGTAFAMLGDHLVAWDLRQSKMAWAVKVVGKSDSPTSANLGQPSLTPPTFANGKLYLGSTWGDLLCVDAQNGAIRWRYRLPGAQSVTSQVILDQGRAYTTTSKGLLVCVDTGDVNAGGWTMWGGTANHNSSVKWLRRSE